MTAGHKPAEAPQPPAPLVSWGAGPAPAGDDALVLLDRVTLERGLSVLFVPTFGRESAPLK